MSILANPSEPILAEPIVPKLFCGLEDESCSCASGVAYYGTLDSLFNTQTT